LEKTANDAFGAYVHMGGKISVLVVLSGVKDEDLARDVAMHVAASNPKYIRREEVPTEVLEKEKEIYSEQLKQQGKPANIIENILKGKIDKFYGEVCLLEQPFIKDEEQKVGRYIESKTPGAKVEKVVRFELGEGMEKKSCDFAAEVAEQMK
jgi:elongation factor Ts